MNITFSTVLSAISAVTGSKSTDAAVAKRQEKEPLVKFVGTNIRKIDEYGANFDLQLVLANGTPLKGNLDLLLVAKFKGKIPPFGFSIYRSAPHSHGWRPHGHSALLTSNGTLQEFHKFVRDNRFLDIHFTNGFDMANVWKTARASY